MRDTVLYYAVGPVHPRNLVTIASGLPNWDFKMIYEPDAHWMTREVLEKIPFAKIPLRKGRNPVSIAASSVRAVIFSTIQPRWAPTNLLRWVMEHELTSIAIEESNQIALNDGVVNNYLLPVNHLLVASPYERRGFVEAGIAAAKVDVTGWPFMQKAAVAEAERRRQARSQLGLDPDRPLATLTLTGFNDPSGETPSVRHRLLALAAKGLPEGFQLAVKPHPIEKLTTLMPFIEKSAPGAAVIEGAVPIGNVLEASDMLLNRGVSQVVIEALNRQIPVVVLSVGRETPFHSLAPDVVAGNVDEVGRVVRHLQSAENPMSLYEGFFIEHMPYAPAEALARTCGRLAEIVEGGQANATTAMDWLELALYQAWKMGREQALATLFSDACRREARLSEALKRLVLRRADRADLNDLKAWCADRHAEYVLRCLWIEQVERQHGDLRSEDIEWMESFPPRTNVNLFLDHCEYWMIALLRAKRFEELTSFSGRLQEVYGHIPEVGAILSKVERFDKGLGGRALYYFRRMLKRTYRSYRKV